MPITIRPSGASTMPPGLPTPGGSSTFSVEEELSLSDVLFSDLFSYYFAPSIPSTLATVTKSFASGSSSTSILRCQPASVTIPAPD